MQDSAENYPSLVRGLDLYSFRKLEHLLRCDRVYLRLLAAVAGGQYDPFETSNKPKPFARNFVRKTRLIDNPAKHLRLIQRNIYDHLLAPLDYPAHVMGGIPGRRVIDNARFHVAGKFLVKLDLKSFFPSITVQHVFGVWRRLLGCSTRISRLLTSLTTCNRHLPQGAPTSTALANLVLMMSDERIRIECLRRGISYSTWVDDLAFSGEHAKEVIGVAICSLQKSGFRISRSKLKVMGPRESKQLNGLLVGARPGIPRKYLSDVRSGIHKLKSGQVPTSSKNGYLRSLEGRISYIASVNPKRAEKLQKALAEVA